MRSTMPWWNQKTGSPGEEKKSCHDGLVSMHANVHGQRNGNGIGTVTVIVIVMRCEP